MAENTVATGVDARESAVEVPAADLVSESLVEEVSIDGMCGVY
ncbi:mycofactocin precursor MftA [Williamsia serinedens]|uniref:Mycofactocin n=1 Tax=Williamsia serinedens TaxID=391736 RepID=A0ABT1H2S5_9NOCA|nr:mycofactocin precursor MftA [Williamsia serinedens]MCP2161446.1 mycofactocin precursor [Williamsia serinedens]